MKVVLAALALAKEQAEKLAMQDDVKNEQQLEWTPPARQELILDFMVALAANSSWHNPELILGLAEDLADAYLTNAMKLPEIGPLKS